jgi:hypothetical protein
MEEKEKKVLLNVNLTLNFNFLYDFCKETIKNNTIDESHALKHAMDVYYYSSLIFEEELKENPELGKMRNIMILSSILHDMCDKKYMKQSDGIENIKNKLEGYFNLEDLEATIEIIGKISYSYIINNGYPDMGRFQKIYDIVGDADRLASFDFERSIVYQMMVKNSTYEESFMDALKLFDNRVFKYREKGLFKTNKGIELSIEFEKNSIDRINFLKKANYADETN